MRPTVERAEMVRSRKSQPDLIIKRRDTTHGQSILSVENRNDVPARKLAWSIDNEREGFHVMASPEPLPDVLEQGKPIDVANVYVESGNDDTEVTFILTWEGAEAPKTLRLWPWSS